MPRAAIISWDHKSGRIQILSTLALNPDGTQPEELEVVRVDSPALGTAHLQVDATPEGMVKLAKFLQRIAPIMPDGSYRPGPQPDPSTHGKEVQKYLNPSGAAGSGHTKRESVSYVELQGILDSLKPPTTE